MCICIYTTSTGVSRCLPRGLRSGRWFNKCSGEGYLHNNKLTNELTN